MTFGLAKTFSALAALALGVASTAGAAAAQDSSWSRSGGGQGIELFASPNFIGESRAFPIAEPDLSRNGFNDRALSVRLSGRGSWQLCEDAQYRGRCVVLNRDEVDLTRLGLGFRVSSIRPVSGEDSGWSGGGRGDDWDRGGGFDRGGGPAIILYENDGFSGRSVRLRGEVRNLAAQGFNDATRSIRTRGRWVVCLDANYEGRCRTIEGDLAELNGIGMASRISSLRPADDYAEGYDPGYPGGGYQGGYQGGGSVDWSGATQGPSTVFFPRPTVGGRPVFVSRDPRRAADDFCRQAGLRESLYAGQERSGRGGDVLSDTLCRR